MLGHSRIGDCVTKSGLFAAGGSPFMMQDIGGAITRACAALHPHRSVGVSALATYSLSVGAGWSRVRHNDASCWPIPCTGCFEQLAG